MNIVTDINEWQKIRKNLATQTLGFVPTMGNLHDGHLSLCHRAKRENELTVVSIFVNPVQFNQTQDFERYPRTLEQDIALLSLHKIDYVLIPDVHAIYPDHYQIQLTETELSQELEGEFRPGHFNGMLTVVLKLINLVQPSQAYFGEKDFQQMLLVKKMVEALFIPTQIISCETIRATDGLALSSRNSRLNVEQRQQAQLFPQLLQSDMTLEMLSTKLKEAGFKIDYLAEKWQRRLGAVWLDEVRLIDNFNLEK
ncbi:MAG: pantoate--beta-alanine ligase [Gammaproteobacteria bacterium]